MRDPDDPIRRAAGEAARHLDSVARGPVSGEARVVDLRRHLEAAYRFDAPKGSASVLDDLGRMLARGTVHAAHPRYFGPFQPAIDRSAVAASTLVAAYNPLATTAAHAPAAVAIEAHLLGYLGAKLGYAKDELSAHFTSGGQEANTEALVVALAARYPEWREQGVRAIAAAPRIYVSAEAHHSIDKAAGIVGLGRDAVVRVAVDAAMRVDLAGLEASIARDRAEGREPFLIVGTAGTTASGAIDPLRALADVARAHGMWMHVDAAFGGSACLSPALRGLLDGIERADSVTWDAHKWLQVPLGAGMFFTRHREAALRAFATDASYMPRALEDAPDPYLVSHAWSRRAAGLPLFAVLAERGEDGVAAMLEATCARADELRGLLVAAGFEVIAGSGLPVVCFTHPRIEAGEVSAGAIAAELLRSGDAFIAPVTLGDGRRVLRACVVNPGTTRGDVEGLVRALAASG